MTTTNEYYYQNFFQKKRNIFVQNFLLFLPESIVFFYSSIHSHFFDVCQHSNSQKKHSILFPLTNALARSLAHTILDSKSFYFYTISIIFTIRFFYFFVVIKNFSILNSTFFLIYFLSIYIQRERDKLNTVFWMKKKEFIILLVVSTTTNTLSSSSLSPLVVIVFDS